MAESAIVNAMNGAYSGHLALAITDGSSSNEGAPNASAYQVVSPDLVERWKELYPDEYED